MDLHFTKMHGLGNDFVIINNIGMPPITLTQKEIIDICNRNFGIGCDQLIILEAADDADCRMLIYNSDGSSSGACGNATRCVAKLLKTSAIRIGERKLKTTLHEDGEVSVNMGAYTKPLAIKLDSYDGHFIDVGNPHFIHFAEGADINVIGPKLERHAFFPKGANINCAHITGSNSIDLAVWERGSGETLACGSGACATAIVARKVMGLGPQINIALKGGILHITVSDDDVIMRGEAREVFTGTWCKSAYYT